jgi:transcriptional regulator with XRE-family HTH domain
MKKGTAATVIGARVRNLRGKESGATIAEEMGISVQYYYGLEKGERRWNDDLINKACDIFNVSTDYLFGKTNTPLEAFLHTENDTIDDLPPEAQKSISEFINFVKNKYKS